MADVLRIILPVFGLIALGYVAVITGFFKAEWTDGLSAFCFRFAIPVLLFSSMASLDFGDVFNTQLLISYYLAALTAAVMAGLLTGKLFGRKAGASVVIGIGAAFSNTVLLGIPVVSTAYGPQAMGSILLIIAFHSPILLTLAAIGMAFSGSLKRGLAQVLRTTTIDMITNPILLGIFAGLAWNYFSLPIGGAFADIVDMLSKAAGPTALFATGASLPRYKLSKAIPEASLMTIIKLMVHPALVAGLALIVFDLPLDTARIAILLAAMPCGVNVFLIANYYKTAEGAASSAVVLSTLASFATISVVLILLGTGG